MTIACQCAHAGETSKAEPEHDQVKPGIGITQSFPHRNAPQPIPIPPDAFEGVSNVLFLLDCSKSMDQIASDKETKFKKAVALIEKTLSKMPESLNYGLRVFGQQDEEHYIDPDRATKMLIEPAPGQKKVIKRALLSIKAYGMCPISYCLDQVFEKDLVHLGGKTVLVLLIDGPDTCGHNPVELIKTMPRRGLPEAKIIVLSLADRRQQSASEMHRELAALTNGAYYNREKIDSFPSDVKKITSRLDNVSR